MHLSIRLIFTLACQMTTGEMEGRGGGSRMESADWLSSARHYKKHLSSSRLLKHCEGPEISTTDNYTNKCSLILKRIPRLCELFLESESDLAVQRF